MTRENAASVPAHPAGLTPENAERLAKYADHLQRSPLPGHRALEPRAKLHYLRVVGAWPSVRDRAIALLPLYAGTRIVEIRALDVADVRLSARGGEIHLAGKGEKCRTVAVHPVLREALAAWLEERLSRPGAGSAALFRSSRGTRMTTDAIADVITAIATVAGIDHVTGHVLRHTFGSELTRRGVDIVTVAELMGHASLETTRLDTRPSAADMQRAIDLLTADE